MERDKFVENIAGMLKQIRKDKLTPVNMAFVRELRKSIKTSKGKKTQKYYICQTDNITDLIYEITNFLCYLIDMSEKEDVSVTYMDNLRVDEEKKFITPCFGFSWRE